MANPFEEFVNELDPIDPTEPPEPGPSFRSSIAPGRWRLSQDAMERAREQMERWMDEAVSRLLSDMAADLDAKIMSDSQDEDE